MPRAALRLVLAAVVGAAFVACTSSRHGAAGGHRAASGRVPSTPDASTITARLAPFQLPVPVSRSVALPAGRQLRILGGLGSGQQTLGAVWDLDPATGTVQQVGQLRRPVHDAAGVLMGDGDVILGGGSPATIDTVQRFDVTTGGETLAQLPHPRSDLAAVAMGDRVYVLGGYDGAHLDPAVLAMAGARSFSQVASLPEPVRYAAVAASAHDIFVIGGTAASGDIAAIQKLDTSTGKVSIAGHLVHPLSHAAAVPFGRYIYVLGGRSAGKSTAGIERFDTATGDVREAGRLPQPTSDAAAASLGGVAYLIGGERDGQPQRTVVELRSGSGSSEVRLPARQDTPFSGRLLIADRGNDRLILVTTDRRILWTYPSPSAPPPPGGFYFPDDAFFTNHGTDIISNQEENHTIVRIAFPSGKVIWSYGHPRHAGSAPGYLDQPDDAYLLKDGTVTVADATNCRVLMIAPNGSVTGQIGSPGACAHHPPTALAYPNGDTPLANGNLLISEVRGSWISEYTRDGKLVWDLKLPIAYPSDPQQLGPDLYLVADYARPGGVYEFTREGAIVWAYRVTGGEGMLDHPSLAEMLPTGLIAVNDDYRHRVVLIDPATSRIVWQYGQTDKAGTGPNELNTPDGMDLLAPDNSTPTHPQTG